MSEPLQRVFYGQSGGPALYLAGTGHLDGGARFQFRARSNPLTPAGRSGEAIFPAAWLTVTHTMAVTLRVSAYLDGVLLPDCVYDLDYEATAERTTVTRELGLFSCICDHLDPSVAIGTVAPRGAALEILVESLVDDGGALVPGLAAGDLIIDSVDIEAEVVRESIEAEAAA